MDRPGGLSAIGGTPVVRLARMAGDGGAEGSGAFRPEMRPAGQPAPRASGIPAYFAHANSSST
jgi:hypothetical protein